VARPAMTWQVNAVDEFTDWLEGLDLETQKKVLGLRLLLERTGPTLGRPYADRIAGSTVFNLKELRPSSSRDEALRVLFYFDPVREALLLVGGNKAGDWTGWYEKNIPVAEARIERHERELATRAAEGTPRTTTKRRKK
jgi:hypothetical protein